MTLSCPFTIHTFILIHWPLKIKYDKHSSRKLQRITNIIRWIWTAKKMVLESMNHLNYYWNTVFLFLCVCSAISWIAHCVMPLFFVLWCRVNCKWMRLHWANTNSIAQQLITVLNVIIANLTVHVQICWPSQWNELNIKLRLGYSIVFFCWRVYWSILLI